MLYEKRYKPSDSDSSSEYPTKNRAIGDFLRLDLRRLELAFFPVHDGNNF